MWKTWQVEAQMRIDPTRLSSSSGVPTALRSERFGFVELASGAEISELLIAVITRAGIIREDLGI
jgi:hypothetical protein